MRVRTYCRSFFPWYLTIGPSATTIISTQLSLEGGGQIEGEGYNERRFRLATEFKWSEEEKNHWKSLVKIMTELPELEVAWESRRILCKSRFFCLDVVSPSSFCSAGVITKIKLSSVMWPDWKSKHLDCIKLFKRAGDKNSFLKSLRKINFFLSLSDDK